MREVSVTELRGREQHCTVVGLLLLSRSPPNSSGTFFMANIASQIKRNRQNETHRRRHQAIRSEMKTLTRQALVAAEAGDQAAAREALRLTQQRIDAAVSRGTLHKNTAARRKSRLHRRVEELLG